MPMSLTNATLPIFTTTLANLAHCLDKAEANASQRGFSPDAFLPLRLAPDMLAFASQIRMACDAAKTGIKANRKNNALRMVLRMYVILGLNAR